MARTNRSMSTNRRAAVVGAGLVVALGAAGCSGTATSSSAAPTSKATSGSVPGTTAAPAAGAPAMVHHVTQAQVDAALPGLDTYAAEALAKTGVPGMAVGIVYDDKLVFAKGYGVREVGKPDAVDPKTVFEVASVSKPIGSTVVAGLVGEGKLAWDDPITKYDPTFTLKDPWVGSHVTVADMFAHRSGLPDHAGDLLEDLGFDRQQVIDRLRYFPLSSFRDSYAYTNFGLTEGAVAAATAAGGTWEDLTKSVLYEPLGMTSTSSRFTDFEAAPNHAKTHVDLDGTWQAKYVRDADAQSPAGGVSSNVEDMAKWMRLQVADGMYEGKQVIDTKALAATHAPQELMKPLANSEAKPSFYGLGWNVGRDDLGRLRLNHSGAFALGTGTHVNLIPSEGLGIVVLTNGEPVGLAEAVGFQFLDLVERGAPQRDWLATFAESFAGLGDEFASTTDWTKPPAAPAPAPASSALVGTYANQVYGPVEVAERDGKLVVVVGPDKVTAVLNPWDGPVFWYDTVGENAAGKQAATFALGADGRATSLTLEGLNHDVPPADPPSDLGVFART